jgi:hypothetical protein
MLNESPKSRYLADQHWRVRAPVDDPRVRAWLAGTEPLTGDMAEHLASLTNGNVLWWMGKESARLNNGIPVLPATPIYIVESFTASDSPHQIAVFTTPQKADACAADYNIRHEVEGCDVFALVRRDALWLPA